jgi:lincosamide nucleotidyltransferase A/C/D/E
MDAHEASEIIALLERNAVEVYVDGGWAVDALLGQQTRKHADLDLALPQTYVPTLRKLLGQRGYQEQVRNGTWECNFVLADAQGREIDVHSYSLDESGKNASGVPYEREHLAGKGFINGHPVRCISPEWLIKFHTGYELDENDFHDVRALCERFEIALPKEFRHFAGRDG